MSDTELEYTANKPKLNTSFNHTVIFSNLPQIPATKVEKLTSVLKKIVTKVGTLDDEVLILMPMNAATSKTHGFAFVTFTSSSDASKCCEAVDKYQFDKNHKVRKGGASEARATRCCEGRRRCSSPLRQ